MRVIYLQADSSYSNCFSLPFIGILQFCIISSVFGKQASAQIFEKKKKMPSRLASHIVAQRAEAIHMRGRSPSTEGGTNRFKLP